jgi:hypothetical protein
MLLQLQKTSIMYNIASLFHVACARGICISVTPCICFPTAELSRTSEKLATIEGQVQSLEERRAAAEAHLHRTQVACV